MSTRAMPAQVLAELKPQYEFFVGIDSDGCAFDSMEIKQKECFCPNTVKHWNLQAIAKYAREAAEFVNLYSKWRGTNRWPALPLAAWETFSLVYYGSLFPNPALAKLGTGIPATALALQGTHYLWNSLRLDPVTLGATAAAVAVLSLYRSVGVSFPLPFPAGDWKRSGTVRFDW